MTTIKQRKIEFYAELDTIEDGLSNKFYNDVDYPLFTNTIAVAIKLNWSNSVILLWTGLMKNDFWKKMYQKLYEQEKLKAPDYVVIPKVFPQFSGSYKACSEFIGENYGAFRLLPKEQWDVVNKMLHSKIEVPDKAEDAVADVKKEFKRKLKILMDSID